MVYQVGQLQFNFGYNLSISHRCQFWPLNDVQLRRLSTTHLLWIEQNDPNYSWWANTYFWQWSLCQKQFWNFHQNDNYDKMVFMWKTIRNNGQIFWRKFSLDRCQDKFKHLPIPRRHAGVKRFHVNRLVTLYLDTRTFNLMWIEVLSLPYCLHHSYAFSLLPEAWLEFLKSLQIDEISI